MAALKQTRTSDVYRTVLRLSLPIAAQNILSTAASSADVVMVGSLGQDALSGVNLANQFYFVLTLIFLGITLGTGVLSAQYWGKQDKTAITSILCLGLKISIGISLLFTLIVIGFPVPLMRLFIENDAVITAGSGYLRIVGISYLFTAISQTYQAVLKSTGAVKISTLIGSSALVLNILFNALFIYGWFGLPKFGVTGIAIATVLARLIEMLWCLSEARKRAYLRFSTNSFFNTDRQLARDYWRCTLPITLNGLSWGSAFATYSVIMGYFGSDMIAANSVVTVARNFVMVGCSGLASGGSIYLGNLMGGGQLELARSDSGKIIWLTILLGALGGGVLLLLQPLLFASVPLTGQSQVYLQQMLYINAYYVVGKSLNIMLNNGIFCVGGDTKFGLICDTVDMWCFSVPMGFLCAKLLHLPAIWVYAIICLDEFVKLPFMIRHYKSNRWLNNITR